MRNRRDLINLGLQTGIYSREKLKPQKVNTTERIKRYTKNTEDTEKY